jgi:hypothetical protein
MPGKRDSVRHLSCPREGPEKRPGPVEPERRCVSG